MLSLMPRFSINSATRAVSRGFLPHRRAIADLYSADLIENRDRQVMGPPATREAIPANLVEGGYNKRKDNWRFKLMIYNITIG